MINSGWMTTAACVLGVRLTKGTRRARRRGKERYIMYNSGKGHPDQLDLKSGVEKGEEEGRGKRKGEGGRKKRKEGKEEKGKVASELVCSIYREHARAR